MRKLINILSAACLILSSTLPAFSQSKKAPPLRETVDLPSDYGIDFQLGITQRPKLRGGSGLLVGTELNQVGAEVFHSLIGNSAVSSLALPYRWDLTLIDDNVLNAGSLSDGETSVHGGLARLLGTNRDLWAAVLSHEVAHTAMRHQVQQYLYDSYLRALLEYYRVRSRYGDKSAGWTYLALSIAVPIASRKFSRHLEHEADVVGMMLMARAGYHPDGVFAVHHMMRIHLGDQSKFGAFFSDHPRWETRDQRSERAYSDALAEFNRLWPDSNVSPGGPPPQVAFLGQPRGIENKAQGTADIVLPLSCRNVNEPVIVVIGFTKDNRPVPS